MTKQLKLVDIPQADSNTVLTVAGAHLRSDEVVKAYMKAYYLKRNRYSIWRPFGSYALHVSFCVFMAMMAIGHQLGGFIDPTKGSLAGVGIGLGLGSIAFIWGAFQPYWHYSVLEPDGTYYQNIKALKAPDYVINLMQNILAVLPKSTFSIAFMANCPVVWCDPGDGVERSVMIYDENGIMPLEK